MLGWWTVEPVDIFIMVEICWSWVNDRFPHGNPPPPPPALCSVHRDNSKLIYFMSFWISMKNVGVGASDRSLVWYKIRDQTLMVTPGHIKHEFPCEIWPPLTWEATFEIWNESFISVHMVESSMDRDNLWSHHSCLGLSDFVFVRESGNNSIEKRCIKQYISPVPLALCEDNAFG